MLYFLIKMIVDLFSKSNPKVTKLTNRQEFARINFNLFFVIFYSILI